MTKIELNKTILQLIEETRGKAPTEPLDGDEVEFLAKEIERFINNHEGNT